MAGSALLALLAMAPGPGRLVGHVYDQTGTPVAGALITATGAGARRMAYASAEGAFSFEALPEGIFAVDATAKKLRPARQPGVRVSRIEAAEVDLILEVEQGVEEVRPDVGCRGLFLRTDKVFLQLIGEVAAPVAREPTGRLVINEEGQRDVLLDVAGDTLSGEMRRARIEVEVRPVEISGHIAGEPVWIFMHGREAEGHIGGHDVSFFLHETPTGYLLRGQAVGHTVRLELSHGELSWLPSCEQPLVLLPRELPREAVYQGACASGRRVRLTVPDALALWRPLPRLILLALLLTERDDGSAAPRLFPPKEGR